MTQWAGPLWHFGTVDAPATPCCTLCYLRPFPVPLADLSPRLRHALLLVLYFDMSAVP